MKIPLNMGNDRSQTRNSTQARVLENEILAAQKGDWEAQRSVTKSFSHLLTSLANKRTSDPKEVSQYVEAGKKGLLTAVKKYKPTVGAANFQLFALDFIEASMERRGKGGFLSKLFGN